MKKVNLEQRTPQWHQWRSEGWTATEAATLMGLNKYEKLSDLWAFKLGIKTRPDLNRVPAVQYGVLHEDDCRRAWEDRHGEVATPVCGESLAHPLFRASFDGLTPSGIPLECKCVTKKEYFDEIVTKGVASERYARYWPQVQHQMLVANSEYAYLCFWHEGEFIEFQIERDEAFIQELILVGERFWAQHIVTKEAPEPEVWAPTGEDAKQWLQLSVHHLADIRMKEKLSAALKVIEDRMKVRLHQLSAIMGDNTVAQADGLRVMRVDRVGSIDYKAYCQSRNVPDEDLKDFQKEGSSFYKATPVKS